MLAKGFLAGFIAGGGDLKSGLIGAATAGAFYGVGTYFDTFKNGLTSLQSAAKVLAHGVVGGASSKLQGGKFATGFISAGAVQGFGQLGGFEALGLENEAQNFGQAVKNGAVAAVIGSASAELGGGKFKNGAITAGFSRLFNDVYHLPDENGVERPFLTGANEVDVEKGTRDALIIMGGIGAIATGPAVVAVGLSGGANSVFWSGSAGAMATAKSLGVSLERTPIGRALDYINRVIGGKLPIQVWRGASRIFANNAKGSAQAVLRNPRPNSTWITIERPILERNGIEIIKR